MLTRIDGIARRRVRRGAWAAAATALATALGACAPAGPANRAILRNFDGFVFGSEYIGQDPLRLRKWVRPIRLAVVGDERKEWSDAVARQVVRLGGATGHVIISVPAGEDANFLVSFLSAGDFAEAQKRLDAALRLKRPGKVYCQAIVMWDEAYRIVEALILIDRDISSIRIRSCIIEETTQALGPLNDVATASRSIFNDSNDYTFLTDLDRLIVRVLYDPRIEPGMSRDRALHMAGIVLDDLRPGR